MIGVRPVQAAAARIAAFVHRTPVHTSRTLDASVGAEVFFKCENLQKVGAFKARGACNAVLSLDDSVRTVVTHSSGNHAAAVAYAASLRDGMNCVVVMPETAPQVKVDAVRGYGAEIIFCPQEKRPQVCEQVLQQRGGVFIHPFEHPDVIAGQGTASLELLEQVPDLDIVITPVGGGGLISGTAVTVSSLSPKTVVYGVEPKAVDDAARSLESGVLQPAVENPVTLGDGLLTQLGEPNFEILQRCGVSILTVSEEAMAAAARFFLMRMKLVVEPSGATVLAAIREHADLFRGKRVGAIVTGGNTDFSWLE